MDKEKEVNSNQESSNKSQAVVEWLLGESIPNTHQIILKIFDCSTHAFTKRQKRIRKFHVNYGNTGCGVFKGGIQN